jgi:outer membrane protein TolC
MSTVTVPALSPSPETEGDAREVLPDNPALGDYLAFAALNSPDLEAAFSRWQAALAKESGSGYLPDPRFTYAYYIERVETRVGPQKHRFSLSQMFPWFGKLDLEKTAAQSAAETAWHRYEAKKLALFYRVKSAYYEYYYLARAIETVEAQLDLVGQAEAVGRKSYEAGGASYADVLKAQVEMARLEDRLGALRDLRAPLVAALNAALDRPVDAELPWPEELDVAAITADEKEVLSLLEETSPELRALSSEADMEAVMVEIEQKKFYPDLTASVTYIDTGDASMPGTSDSGKDPVIAAISVNIPLYRRKYRSGEQAARERRTAVLKQRAAKANDLAARVTAAFYHYRDAGRKEDLYATALIPKARQAYEATLASFAAGSARFVDLVDIQRYWLELEVSLHRSRANRAARLAELEMLAGRELDGEPVPVTEDEMTREPDTMEGE